MSGINKIIEDEELRKETLFLRSIGFFPTFMHSREDVENLPTIITKAKDYRGFPQIEEL